MTVLPTGDIRSPAAQMLAQIIEQVDPLVRPCEYREDVDNAFRAAAPSERSDFFHFARSATMHNYPDTYNGERYVPFLRALGAALAYLDEGVAKREVTFIFNEVLPPAAYGSEESQRRLIEAISELTALIGHLDMLSKVTKACIWCAISDLSDTYEGVVKLDSARNWLKKVCA
jgi:hypothetical protein